VKKLKATVYNHIKMCHDPRNARYHWYGGRGLTVCHQWRDDPRKFYDHLVTLPGCFDPTLSLDRLDNDLGCFPGNMRFVSKSLSARNVRQSTELGRFRCSLGYGLDDVARMAGVSQIAVWRFEHGRSSHRRVADAYRRLGWLG
jgi:hypothetical protein